MMTPSTEQTSKPSLKHSVQNLPKDHGRTNQCAPWSVLILRQEDPNHPHLLTSFSWVFIILFWQGTDGRLTRNSLPAHLWTRIWSVGSGSICLFKNLLAFCVQLNLVVGHLVHALDIFKMTKFMHIFIICCFVGKSDVEKKMKGNPCWHGWRSRLKSPHRTSSENRSRALLWSVWHKQVNSLAARVQYATKLNRQCVRYCKEGIRQCYKS